jgi:hypothetical protein
MASKKLKIFAGVSFCSAVAFVGLVWLIVRTSSPEPTPAPTLNRAAEKFAALGLIDDFEAAERGDESLLARSPDPDLTAWTQIGGTVTVRQYDIAYDANEIAADNQYKGKKLLVSGTIDSIEKDAMDSGFLMLRAANPVGVRAQLRSDAMGEAASFARGQKISLVCIGSGRVVGIANLDDCQSYSDYLSKLNPSLESRVDDFLTGKTALHTLTAQAVVLLYVGGTHLPPGSPCLEGKNDKNCDHDLNAMFNDPGHAQELKTAAENVMAGLKIDRR